MARYYKNMTDHEISVELFGVGRVKIPANAVSVELTKEVADAINGMAVPYVILQETMVTADNPIVQKNEILEMVEQADMDDLLTLTNKQLKELCDKAGIKYHSNANKAELLDLLGKGDIGE